VSIEKTTERVRDLFARADGFTDTLTFDFGDEGIVSVDGNKSPPEVTNTDINSDCTISITLENFNDLLDGNLDPQMAFMSGKLSIDGNMGIAMNLANVLGS